MITNIRKIGYINQILIRNHVLVVVIKLLEQIVILNSIVNGVNILQTINMRLSQRIHFLIILIKGL